MTNHLSLRVERFIAQSTIPVIRSAHLPQLIKVMCSGKVVQETGVLFNLGFACGTLETFGTWEKQKKKVVSCGQFLCF